MLIFSYIVSASLEAALSYMLYQSTGHIPVIYVLLLVSSLLSIPIECSKQGEEVRKAMRAAGKSVDQYDIISNFARSLIYLTVWSGRMPADTGGMAACGCIGAALLMATLRL